MSGALSSSSSSVALNVSDATSSTHDLALKEIVSRAEKEREREKARRQREKRLLKAARRSVPTREQLPRPASLGQDGRDRNPEERGGLLSKLFFAYVSPLVDLGYRRPLTSDDMWKIAKEDESEQNAARLAKVWETEKAKRTERNEQPSFFNAWFAFSLWPILGMIFFQLLERTTQVVQPLLLERLVIWIADPREPNRDGFLLAMGLLLTPAFGAVMQSRFFHIATRLLIQVKAAASTLIYNKSLRVRPASPAGTSEDSTVGQIVNLMSTDTEKMGQMSFTAANFVLTPIQVAVIIYFLTQTIGASTFAGLGVFFALIPVMGVVIGLLTKYTIARLKLVDKRVKLTNEVLQGVRVIKFYAWEIPFSLRIFELRELEMQLLKKSNFLNSFFIFIFLLLPVLVSLVAFATYVNALGNRLDPATAFRAVGFFNALQFPLIQLPSSFASIVTGVVSSRRIQAFLLREEIPQRQSHEKSSSSDKAPVRISNGSFKWDAGKQENTLSNINIEAEGGKLTAIIGPVGSGKSSVLSAILGDMHKTSGTVVAPEKMAYVSQTAWIQNASIESNILFGAPMDRQRYEETIRVCALDADLAVLPAGDQTEIGDRGINLSGGQKQRVAIARAVYANVDVIVFDDPLSAVDSNVCEHIFSDCIVSYLRSKTRVFVTNQLHLLPRCDIVYVMKDGAVADSGTYADLSERSEAFAQLMAIHTQDLNAHHRAEEEASSERKTELESLRKSSRAQSLGGSEQHKKESEVVHTDAAKAAGRELVGEEELFVGSVSGSTYMTHFHAMGSWLRFIIPAFLAVAVSQGLLVSSNLILAWWSEDRFNEPDSFYLTIYGGVAVGSTVALLCRGLIFAVSSVRGSRSVHKALFDAVIRARLAFFDVTPVGRILNRFSKDIDNIDGVLPNVFQNLIGVMSGLVGSLVAVCFIAPYFTAIVLFVSAVFFYVQRHFKPAALQLQRIQSVSRSPIYQQFSETLNGVSAIRAFGVENQFRDQSQAFIDLNSQSLFLLRLVFRWVGLRVGVLNALLTGGAAFLIAATRDSIDPALAGAALSFVISVGGYIGFAVILLTETDNSMNAVERVRFYTTDIEEEPPFARKDDSNLVDWPSEGRITLRNVVMSYRDGLEPAIRGVNATIEPREKVGVAGRTGSGKSTVMLAMFRMYDLSSGTISIDGVDISKVGLHKLRSALAIIPQDPVVFSGTLRENLDPFDEHTDEELLDVCAHVHLKKFVESQEDGLRTPVAEYGTNMSVGQRQLLCMGRALLRKPKILLMDEATSSIDTETDHLIQQTVREQFRDATVITIAHRLNTIMDSDRVLVLDNGKVAEFDTPSELLQKKSGVFRKMHSAMVQSQQ